MSTMKMHCGSINLSDFGRSRQVCSISIITFRECRYYYAIVTCDTAEAASHIYLELEGTELERSANVFDLSFVPDEMTFDDEYRCVQDFRCISISDIKY